MINTQQRTAKSWEERHEKKFVTLIITFRLNRTFISTVWFGSVRFNSDRCKPFSGAIYGCVWVFLKHNSQSKLFSFVNIHIVDEGFSCIMVDLVNVPMDFIYWCDAVNSCLLLIFSLCTQLLLSIWDSLIYSCILSMKTLFDLNLFDFC